MNRATWKNGKRTIGGSWEYIPASDRFVILLDQRDRVTGLRKQIVTAGSQRELPEWGNWKFQREEQSA
jgi:hypothetical protein